MKRTILISLIFTVIVASVVLFSQFNSDKLLVPYALGINAYIESWSEAVSAGKNVALIVVAIIGIPCFISGYREYLKYPSGERIKNARNYTMKQIPLLLLIVLFPLSLVMVGKLTHSLGIMIAFVRICRKKDLPVFREHKQFIALQIAELIVMTWALSYVLAFVGSI